MSAFTPRVVHVPGQVFIPTTGCKGSSVTLLLHADLTHMHSTGIELVRCTCIAGSTVKTPPPYDTGGMGIDDKRTQIVPAVVSRDAAVGIPS